MGKHSIVHVELPANDPEAAAGFYSSLFGWKTESSATGGGAYWHFRPDDQPGGGFNPVGTEGMMQVEPGDIFIYISTDDIEATLAKAESLGGKILMKKQEIPGMGWWALFADPTGNKIGVYADGARSE